MTALAEKRMTVDEFLAWAAEEPGRWELFDGVPVAMAPERVTHGRSKSRLVHAFDNAIAEAKLPCEFLIDSAAVRIDVGNMYQPDGMVSCGEPLSGDALEVPEPVIVVEVLSPGNAIKDLRDKLLGYFRVPSIQHYLIVDPDKKLVIHHARGQDDTVATRIVSEGSLKLDPPGLALPVAALFGD
jgi:Uma2 family endonuclease